MYARGAIYGLQKTRIDIVKLLTRAVYLIIYGPWRRHHEYSIYSTVDINLAYTS